jgi:hypothetical protein
MLPRQDPSYENSQESRGGSQKFQPSTCGVEMLADGGFFFSGGGRDNAAKRAAPHLTCMASPLPGRPCPVKAGSREAGARDARQPLPDGAGLAPSRQADAATCHPKGPSPCFLPKSQFRQEYFADGVRQASIGQLRLGWFSTNPGRSTQSAEALGQGAEKSWGDRAMSGPEGRPEVDGTASNRRE